MPSHYITLPIIDSFIGSVLQTVGCTCVWVCVCIRPLHFGGNTSACIMGLVVLVVALLLRPL